MAVVPRLSTAIVAAPSTSRSRPTCVGCGLGGRAVCEPVPSRARRAARPARRASRSGSRRTCRPHVLQLEWCAPFAGLVRDALHDLKYAGERRLAEPLGAASPAAGHVPAPAGTLLVPVPVHRGPGGAARLRPGGPAVGRGGERTSGLPMRVGPAPRWQATTAQFELDRRARATNVAGAFADRIAPMTPRSSAAAGSCWSTTS